MAHKTLAESRRRANWEDPLAHAFSQGGECTSNGTESEEGRQPLTDRESPTERIATWLDSNRSAFGGGEILRF
jgi:hypothetical protein